LLIFSILIFTKLKLKFRINQEFHETKLKLQEANCLNKCLIKKYANVSEANNLLEKEIETLSKQNIELKTNFENKIH